MIPFYDKNKKVHKVYFLLAKRTQCTKLHSCHGRNES
nr:MAG TPA: hypothetical protein [Caudoviricetes sp.]